MTTFVEDVLRGAATLQDLNEYRDRWDENPFEERELHEALGFLWPGSAMWVENDDTAEYVIRARREAVPLLEYLRLQAGDPVAAELLRLADRYAEAWNEAENPARPTRKTDPAESYCCAKMRRNATAACDVCQPA